MNITPTRSDIRGRIARQTRDDLPLKFSHSIIHKENLRKLISKLGLGEGFLDLLKESNITSPIYCKEELLLLLESYKFFNREKFDSLPEPCYMDQIFDALDLPRYDDVKPYFAANTDIIRQNETYPLEEVGDSDDEFEPSPQLRWFTLDRPLIVQDTTVKCMDGSIKGDMLIHMCHLVVYSQLNEFHGNFEPLQDEKTGKVLGVGLGDHSAIRDLGNYMFEQSASSEKAPRQEKLMDYVISTIEHPNHEVTFEIVQRGCTTRLINPELKLFGFSVKKTDLSYSDINKINQTVLNFLEKKLTGTEGIDQKLARLQLARLKDIEQGSNLFREVLGVYSSRLTTKGERELMVWLDYVNTLIFNIESSRINTTLITGLMMLKLIESGQLTYKEAFYNSSRFLGQFPGSSIGAKHNFKTRAQLLYHMGTVGMRADRQHAKWLMVTLKEAMLILNWFKIFVLKDRNPLNYTRDELIREFTIEAHVLMQSYLQVESEM